MIDDPTFWLYLLIVGISFMGFLLFISNWARIGEATGVYKCVTGLLFGLFAKNLIELYSFIIRETGYLEKFLDLIHSPVWDLRFLLILAPLIALVVQMYYRFLIKRRS